MWPNIEPTGTEPRAKRLLSWNRGKNDTAESDQKEMAVWGQ